MAVALPYIAAIGTIATAYSTVQQAQAAKKTPQTIMQPAQKEKDLVMPSADDDAMRAAKRKSLLEQLSRGGRESTILSGGNGGSSTLG